MNISFIVPSTQICIEKYLTLLSLIEEKIFFKLQFIFLKKQKKICVCVCFLLSCDIKKNTLTSARVNPVTTFFITEFRFEIF